MESLKNKIEPETKLSYIQITRGKPSRLVFLLHGYGKNNEFMEKNILEKIQNENITFILPNAPHPYNHSDAEGSGEKNFFWFSLHDLNFPKMAPSIQETGHLVCRFIENIASELNIPFSKVVVSGFSQGGMLSCQVGATFAHQIAGVVSLSGLFTLASTVGEKLNQNINYTIIHGDSDTAVPVSHAHKAVEELEKIAGNVELRIVKDIDHEINEEVASLTSDAIDKYTL